MTAGADEVRHAAAAQAGDRAAFDQLVLGHKAPLYRFVRRYIGDADEAYDVVQDTFVAAWLALHRFDLRQPFAAWLRAIALNKCRDHGRRRAVRRRISLLFASEAHALQAPDPSHVRETGRQALRLQRLDRAIAALPRIYKEPLLLTMVSGLTQAEAAQELRTTTKAIEMRIRRAKRQLSQALSDPRDPGANA